jgi:hypothetical protein
MEALRQLHSFRRVVMYRAGWDRRQAGADRLEIASSKGAMKALLIRPNQALIAVRQSPDCINRIEQLVGYLKQKGDTLVSRQEIVVDSAGGRCRRLTEVVLHSASVLPEDVPTSSLAIPVYSDAFFL